MNLFELIGCHKQEDTIEVFLNEFGNEYTFIYFPKTYYRSFQSKGISLLFNIDDHLRAIFLYNQGHDDFDQYTGELPYGLLFTMNKQEIENKLGIAEHSYPGSQRSGSFSSYLDLGITITYAIHQQDKEMDSFMAHICLQNFPTESQKARYFIYSEHEVVLRLETELSGDLVTAILGIDPTVTVNKEEFHFGEQKIRQKHYWEYRMDIRKSMSAGPQLTILLDKLEPIAEKVRQLSLGTDSRITIISHQYLRDKEKSLRLSQKQMERIVSLGLGVEYFFDTQ